MRIGKDHDAEHMGTNSVHTSLQNIMDNMGDQQSFINYKLFPGSLNLKGVNVMRNRCMYISVTTVVAYESICMSVSTCT